MPRNILNFGLLCIIALFNWPIGADAQQKYFVEIDVITSPHLGIDVNQRWLEVLSDVGADNVRIRQRGGTRPGVQKVEGSLGATYKITGILDSRARLAMPGGTFSYNDKASLRDLIEKIRDDGAEVALAEKMAFGLTAEQLVELHKDLSGTIRESTKDSTPETVFQQVKRSIKTPIVMSPGAAKMLKGSYVLEDDLRGMSHGTALAAALRPVGLVVAPRRLQGKQTEIVIADSRDIQEHWPIGWPLEVRPSEAAPILFDRVPANIDRYPLGKALSSLQGTLELPFLYDYNSMARKGIDINKIPVSLQSDKISYMIVLKRIVAQARPRMEMEIRADEAGKPFIWFSAR